MVLVLYLVRTRFFIWWAVINSCIFSPNKFFASREVL